MLSTQITSQNPEIRRFDSERDDHESSEKIQMFYKHLKDIAPSMKDATLLEALFDAGVPSSMSVLQRSYAYTRNIEETRKLNPGFEDSTVITCCTLNLGTVSPRNYINEGIRKMTDSNLPSKKLTYLFVQALMNKKKCAISNASFPDSVIYIDELDLDAIEIKKGTIIHLDRFTIASRIKENVFRTSGVPTTNRVVIRIMGEVQGWSLFDTTGERYKNTFILPPFLNLYVNDINYSDSHKLYVVYATPTNNGAFLEEELPKGSAKGIHHQKAIFDTYNPVTGEKIHVSAVTGREAPLLELPENWGEYFDQESGNYFYYNRKTKEKQWEHPSIKYVSPDMGSWDWNPGEEEDCGYTLDEKNKKKVTVTKDETISHIKEHEAYKYAVPSQMMITSSAITQWKIEILDFGGISPMILVGVVQMDDMRKPLKNDGENPFLKYKGWFINCTGLSLFGTEPSYCVNKSYTEPKTLGKGDSIICEINTMHGTLSFYVNDKFCGEAFVGIPGDKYLSPCVCMSNYKDSVALTPPGSQN